MADSRRASIIHQIFAPGGKVSILAGLSLLVALLTAPAHAAKPTTWIVIDASSGQVLAERDPDALNYPASLTKMMTLYLTFDALERHRIDLAQRFYVSEHAHLQHPSKLGLEAGSTIAVRDLILAVVTHSANDAAVVLAEGLAGTESAFADKMNAAAQALGMTRTNFRNASGLPDPFQYTTARDLAKLARALCRGFPQEYRYFATEEFDYNGAIYTNHNRLMASFEGMDGIKTGWINASGFNLAASAVRDHRRLIGVLMGGQTPQARDMDMAELLDDAFAHRAPGNPPDVAVAANDAPDGGRDNVDATQSAISPDNAANTLNAGSDFDFDKPAYRPARAHHYARFRHRYAREAGHHRYRRGVVLARVETSRINFHRRHMSHRYAALNDHRGGARHYLRIAAVHRQRVAARQHVAGRQRSAARQHAVRLAELRRRDRRAASAGRSMHRSHGGACGGWNGSSRPCPASYSRRPRGRSA